MIGLCRINKSSRLVVVDGLREGAMQEHILHIKLMNRPGVEDGQGENSVDRGWLDHRAEGLIVVSVESPSEAVKDPTRLVPFQRAVEVEHVIENPKSVKQVTKELRRAWCSDRLGSWSNCQPLYGGGLTIWAHGLTASLYSGCGPTAWAHGVTVSLCSGRGQTTRTCGLTASCGQRWKAR
jgi:hypothetical protein